VCQCRESEGGGGRLLFHGQTDVVLRGQRHEGRSNPTHDIRGFTSRGAHHMCHAPESFQSKQFCRCRPFWTPRDHRTRGRVCRRQSENRQRKLHQELNFRRPRDAHIAARCATHSMSCPISPPISQQRMAVTRAATLAAPIHASCLFSNDCFMLSKCSGSPAAK
jgi:hypothetical protein